MTQPAERAAAGTGSAFAALWAVVAAAVCGWMAPLEPSLLEEGYLVHFAQRMLAGEHLYRDMVTFTGPLPFELLALLFRVFGEEIVAGRVFVALLHGAAAAAAYDMGRRGGAGALAHVGPAAIAAGPVLLFPLVSIYFYSGIAYLLCIIAAWAAARAPGDARFAVATGVLIAAVALCKQTTGAALGVGLLGVVAFASRRDVRLRRCAEVAAGGAAVTIATLLVYALRGDLAPFFRGMVMIPLALESSFGSPYPNLWPIGELAPEVVANLAYYMPHVAHLLAGGEGAPSSWAAAGIQTLYALPWVALLAAAWRAARGQLSAEAAGAAVVTAAFAIGLFPRSDWGHLLYVLPPSLVLLGLLGRDLGRVLAYRVAAALVVFALGVSVALVGAALHRIAGPASFGPRVPQRPVSAIYRGPGLPRVIEFLRARLTPGEPIFVPRMEPLVYFAAEASNPTPFGGVIPGIRAEQEAAIAKGLEAVRFVVMSDLDRPVFTYYRDELPGVQALLERHFRVAPAFAGPRASWISVLERAEDRGAAAVDLFDLAGRGEAERWVFDERGERREAPGEPPRLGTRQNRRPLAVVLGPRGGGIDFRISLPERPVLQLDLGLRGLEAEAGSVIHADRVRMQVAIAEAAAPDEGDGSPSFTTLRRVRLDYGRSGGRGWRPVEIDLSEWAGGDVVLRLESLPDRPRSRAELVWWGSPRVVSGAPGRRGAG